MLNAFELLTPASLDEAISLYSKYDCTILAGGTDLLVEMHAGKEIPCLMDIKQIEELKGICWSVTEGLSIGALVTFAELERNDAVKTCYPALIDSISKTASTQIRMRGTIAGNICTASPAGDSAAPLLAYDAVVSIKGPNGVRTVPIAEFFEGYKKTVLSKGEILTRIVLPAPDFRNGSAAIKFTRRKAMDIGIIGCAAGITLDQNGVCTKARIAMLSVAPTPIRIFSAEDYLTGKALTDETIEKAGELAYETAQPKTWRSSEEYSRDMVKVVVPQALRIAAERIGKENITHE